MKLKQRLTYAVMCGLNESFDIEDMDNKIGNTSTKEKIDKHSKIYKQIMEFINKGYPLKNAKKCYRMLQPDDIELLEFLYLHRDLLDTDANVLDDEYDMSMLFVTIYIKGMKDEINDRLKTHKYLTATQQEFIRKYAQDIHSKDHPLYAFHRPATKENLETIVRKSDDDANLNWIDTSRMEDMSYLFKLSSFNGDISLWDVGNVKRMHYMFYNSKFNGDISKWDVSNVETMAAMFLYNLYFKGDMSKWNVSKVTNMKFMFAYSDFRGDISEWDVSSLINTQSMFEKCPFNGDLSKWRFDGEHLYSMKQMFYDSMFDGDISGWNVGNADNMQGMFAYSKFDHDISNWIISDECSVETMFYMAKTRDAFKPPLARKLNESFDIEDMGNIINTSVSKDGVDKHSKIYKQLKAFVAKGYPLKDFKECYGKLTIDDIDLLEYISAEHDVLDEETARFVDQYDLMALSEYVYVEDMKEEMNCTLRCGGDVTESKMRFLREYASDIHSKDHQLYAFCKPRDGDELKKIIKKVSKTITNLNWIDTSSIRNMSYLFSYSRFDGDISLWDVSSVETMERMFCNSVFNGDISGWDVSNVLAMEGMFMSSVFNGDISRWDVSHVRDMRCMFNNSEFNGDISEWDVSSLENADYMFCESNFNGDLSMWRFSESEHCSMREMFAQSKFDGDISGWNVGLVDDMKRMFAYSQFDHDISEWLIDDSCDVCKMFYKAKTRDAFKPPVVLKLNESFDIEDMRNDITPASSEKKMVRKHSKRYLEIEAFIARYGSLENPGKTYRKMTKTDFAFLKEIYDGFDELDPEMKRLITKKGYRIAYPLLYLYGIIVPKLRNNQHVFDHEWSRLTNDITTKKHPLYAIYPAGCKAHIETIRHKMFADQNLNWLDTSMITDMSSIFDDSSFEGDISLWDTSNVTNMSRMFIDSYRFHGDISKWDVSKVTNMAQMFANSNFDGDISKWDVSSVEIMDGMFEQAKKFDGAIGNWDVRNVRNMQHMFDSSKFNHDISGWDVSNVKNMRYMFTCCPFNKDISDWEISDGTNTSHMFFNCPIKKAYMPEMKQE